MADLAPARAPQAAGLAHTEGREVVMQNEALRLFAATVSVDHLCFFDRRKGRKRHCLSFAALEDRRAMRPREHADFATDRAQVVISAAIDPLLLIQNVAPE